MNLSYHLDISSGATIVLVNFALFAVVYAVTGVKGVHRLGTLAEHPAPGRPASAPRLVDRA